MTIERMPLEERLEKLWCDVLKTYVPSSDRDSVTVLLWDNFLVHASRVGADAWLEGYQRGVEDARKINERGA